MRNQSFEERMLELLNKFAGTLSESEKHDWQWIEKILEEVEPLYDEKERLGEQVHHLTLEIAELKREKRDLEYRLSIVFNECNSTSNHS